MATAARTADPPLTPRPPVQPATAPTLKRQAPGSFLDRAAVSGALGNLHPPAVQRAQTPRVQSPQKAATPTVDRMVSGRASEIAGQDSPLMKQARQAGFRHAASRGLLSSSIAGQAAQEAVLGRAEGIAAQDIAQGTARRELGLRERMHTEDIGLRRDDLALRRELGVGQLGVAQRQVATQETAAETGRRAQAATERYQTGQLGIEQQRADIAAAAQRATEAYQSGDLRLRQQDMDQRREQFWAQDRREGQRIENQARDIANRLGLGTEQNRIAAARQVADVQYQNAQVKNDLERIKVARYQAETESERLALDAQQAQAQLWSNIVGSASKTYAAKVQGLMQVQDMDAEDRTAAMDRFEREYFAEIEAGKQGHSKFAGEWPWTPPERPEAPAAPAATRGPEAAEARRRETNRSDSPGPEGNPLGGGTRGGGYGREGGGMSGGSPHR